MTVKDQIVMAGNSATSTEDYADSVANILLKAGIEEPAPGLMKKILCTTMENQPGGSTKTDPLMNEIYGLVSKKTQKYSRDGASDVSMSCHLVAKSSLFDNAVKQRQTFEETGTQIERWAKKVRETGKVVA